MKRKNKSVSTFTVGRDTFTITTYDNGKKGKRWRGGTEWNVLGAVASYDGFQTREEQEENFMFCVEKFTEVLTKPVGGLPKPPCAAKPATGKEPDIFKHFLSVSKDFFKAHPEFKSKPASAPPAPNPEKEAMDRLMVFLAENYPNESTSGNPSATTFAAWPADIAIDVIKKLRANVGAKQPTVEGFSVPGPNGESVNPLKSLGDLMDISNAADRLSAFLAERYAGRVKDGEHPCDAAIRLLTHDPEQVAGCPSRDVWNDFRSIAIGHDQKPESATRVAVDHPEPPADVAVAPLAPEDIAKAAKEAFFEGKPPSTEARFAVGITVPDAPPVEPNPIAEDVACAVKTEDAVDVFREWFGVTEDHILESEFREHFGSPTEYGPDHVPDLEGRHGLIQDKVSDLIADPPAKGTDTQLRIGGKRLKLSGDVTDAEALLKSMTRTNIRALIGLREADVNGVNALREFMKGDIQKDEHPTAAAIRRIKALGGEVNMLGKSLEFSQRNTRQLELDKERLTAEVGQLTESVRKPVQWIRVTGALPVDCHTGFVEDGPWQLVSNDSGVVTWRRPMRASEVQQKKIVVLRSPGNKYNGRHGKLCFLDGKPFAMWLDVGNCVEHIPSLDGIDWDFIEPGCSGLPRNTRPVSWSVPWRR